jgi:hypothetical protein
MDFKLEDEKRENYKAKFYWENDKDKMWIELVVIPDEEINDIVKKHTKVLIDFALHPETKRMVRVETPVVNYEKITDEMIDKGWVGWGNFTLNGKELDFTFENKKLLIGKVKGFEKFYSDSVNTITADFKERFGSKEKRKN